MDRRAMISFAMLTLIPGPAFCADEVQGGKFPYRGFTVDISSAPNFTDILDSIKHQIDIVADCGVKPDILAFFQSQIIVLKSSGDHGGEFDSNSEGVSAFASAQPPDNPVILHELLHAYHFRMVPERFSNPVILRFYSEAKLAGYKEGAYLLKNPQEFFAVTASLYLWGKVARPPFTRENLKVRQPDYYAWLGQLFGVEK
jgi:hypothetical protein